MSISELRTSNKVIELLPSTRLTKVDNAPCSCQRPTYRDRDWMSSHRSTFHQLIGRYSTVYRMLLRPFCQQSRSLGCTQDGMLLPVATISFGSHNTIRHQVNSRYNRQLDSSPSLGYTHTHTLATSKVSNNKRFDRGTHASHLSMAFFPLDPSKRRMFCRQVHKFIDFQLACRLFVYTQLQGFYSRARWIHQLPYFG